MILFLYLFLYVCFYGKEALMYVFTIEWLYSYFFFFRKLNRFYLQIWKSLFMETGCLLGSLHGF